MSSTDEMPATGGEEFQETVQPYREPGDVSLDDMTEEGQAEVSAEIEEMLRRDAEGEQVAH